MCVCVYVCNTALLGGVSGECVQAGAASREAALQVRARCERHYHLSCRIAATA
jgi:hypothetical protein